VSEQQERDPGQHPSPAAADPAAADGIASASGAVEPEEELTAEPEAPARADDAGADEAGADEAGADEAQADEAGPGPGPDFRDQYLRAAAELDNVRKRARRDVAAAEGRGIARLARELLPALDDFERALAAAESQPENQDHHLTDGIRLVQAQLLGALKRVGIEPDAPKGERFDPHRHEALAQQPVDGAESGTIVEVYSAGYRIGDDVLRPAKVVVAA
jgi:molecular chaperone GrpE